MCVGIFVKSIIVIITIDADNAYYYDYCNTIAISIQACDKMTEILNHIIHVRKIFLHIRIRCSFRFKFKLKHIFTTFLTCKNKNIFHKKNKTLASVKIYVSIWTFKRKIQKYLYGIFRINGCQKSYNRIWISLKHSFISEIFSANWI